MNIFVMSEPLVNYIILWENCDLQFIKKKLWFSIYPESYSSSLAYMLFITAYNSFKV